MYVLVSTGPSQLYYEEVARENKRVLFCLAFGLRDVDNSGQMMALCDFTQEPFTNFFKTTKEGSKAYKPSAADLRNEVTRRWELPCYQGRVPMPKPRTMKTIPELCEWLEQHPIQDPRDVAFIVSERDKFLIHIQEYIQHYKPAAGKPKEDDTVGDVSPNFVGNAPTAFQPYVPPNNNNTEGMSDPDDYMSQFKVDDDGNGSDNGNELPASKRKRRSATQQNERQCLDRLGGKDLNRRYAQTQVRLRLLQRRKVDIDNELYDSSSKFTQTFDNDDNVGSIHRDEARSDLINVAVGVEDDLADCQAKEASVKREMERIVSTMQGLSVQNTNPPSFVVDSSFAS